MSGPEPPQCPSIHGRDVPDARPDGVECASEAEKKTFSWLNEVLACEGKCHQHCGAASGVRPAEPVTTLGCLGFPYVVSMSVRTDRFRSTTEDSREQGPGLSHSIGRPRVLKFLQLRTASGLSMRNYRVSLKIKH